jgi:YbbR domain-containing protein
LRKIKFPVLKKFYKKQLFNRIDRKIITYLIFVIIASIFWFINKVGNEFSTTIDYPVTYVNMPKDKVLVSELPDALHLSINAYGYDILRFRLSPKPYPIIIDAQKLGIDLNKPKIKHYRLATRYLRENINSQISNEIEITDIMPDTINFDFSHMVKKEVPIKSTFNIEFNAQCMLDGEVEFNPKSVLVSGPKSILDTLHFIETKLQNFKGIDKTFQINAELQEYKNLQIESTSVVATIPVSKLTEATFELLIMPVNVPDSLKMITFPGMVKLTCQVPFNKYEITKADDFSIEVNYMDIEKQLGLKLPTVLKNFPPYATNISVVPQSVEFILERK